jgi:hypothetical protein
MIPPGPPRGPNSPNEEAAATPIKSRRLGEFPGQDRLLERPLSLMPLRVVR